MAIASRSPVEAELGLAGLAERQGQRASADAHFERALTLAPNDAAVLTRVAAARLYGTAPESAAPLMPRLAALKTPTSEVWRMLADFYQRRDPERAARALDALAEAGAGDAETYFRRGELASVAGEGSTADEAFTRAAELGAAATEPLAREAGAYALERLGRGTEARARWQALAGAHPERPAAFVALARLHQRDGALAAAGAMLDRAEAIAPGETLVRLARAEWLRAVGREAEAAEAFAGLRQAEPQARYLAAAEAMARDAAGQHGRAREVARAALAEAPGDRDLEEAYRLVRETGGDKAGFTAFTERYAGLDRLKLGLTASHRFSDRLRMLTSVSRLSWSGGAVQTQQLGLGLTAELARGLTATASVDLPAGPGGVSMPLGSVGVALARGPVTAALTFAEARWEETNVLVARGGRERKAILSAGWRPDPRLGLRAEVEAGQLSLADGRSGPAGAGTVEVALRPEAASRWSLYFQLHTRHWGAMGPPLGLPEQLIFPAASLGYADRLGPFRVELQPGVLHDPTTRRFQPTAAGSLALALGPDRELALAGAWSGAAIAVGQTGSYEQVSVSGAWWF